MPRRRRRYGTGSVFQSKGRWVAQVTVRDADGKRRYHTRKRRTEDQAKAALDTLQGQLGLRDELLDSSQPLGRWMLTWLDDHGPTVRESTKDSYETHIRVHIDPLIGHIPLDKLRPEDVKRLKSRLLAAGKSPAYVQRIMVTLRMALSVAEDERLFPRSPARSVRSPKVERAPIEAMTRAEAARIREAVAGHWTELAVRVWLGSGLRRGEVMGLDQRDLALEEGYVRVRVSKTKVRAVPVTDDAIDALREALIRAPRRGPAEPVFFGTRTHDRMRGDSVTHALTKVSGVSPHALRHGVATMMVAKGHNLKVVAQQLGHSSTRMTERYAHIVPEQQRAAIESIDEEMG